MRVTQEPTPAELAILEIVSEGETHGYGIEAVIKDREMRKWTAIGFSSIYAILQRLEKAGLVEGRSQVTGRLPIRKVYRITPGGRATLRRIATRFLSEPERAPFRIYLGIESLHVLQREEAIHCLKEYCASLGKVLTEIEEARGNQPLPLKPEAIFDHAIRHCRAELEWAEDFLNKLESRLSDPDG